MDVAYKEVPFRGQRPSPWKMKPSPKFTDVYGPNYTGHITNNDDEDPPAPPPSPMGTFKYPALLQASKAGPRTTFVDAILTEIHKTTNNDTAYQGNEKRLKKVQPETPHNLMVNVDPAIGKTNRKMYSRPDSECTDCRNRDFSSLTKKRSEKCSSKSSTNAVEYVACRFSAISVKKKSLNFFEAGDTGRVIDTKNTMILNPLKNRFGTMSTEDGDVILKHALSHNSVTAKQDPISRMQRSMTLTDKPKTVVPIKKEKDTRFTMADD